MLVNRTLVPLPRTVGLALITLVHHRHMDALVALVVLVVLVVLLRLVFTREVIY